VADAKVQASELLRNMTLRVRLVGVKTMRVRVWIGTRVIRLGAAIIGCAIELVE
jgi:hypothetical protein